MIARLIYFAAFLPNKKINHHIIQKRVLLTALRACARIQYSFSEYQ
jgi:hypothetical protein